MPTKSSSARIIYDQHFDTYAAGNLSHSHSYPVVVHDKTRTGSPVPNWKNLIRAGANATSTLTASTFFVPSFEKGSFSVSWKYNTPVGSPPTTTGYVTGRGALIIPGVISAYGGDLTEADNKAKMQAYQAIADLRRHWQGGVFLGEMLETARMLMRPAKALKGLVEKHILVLKNKKRRMAAKHYLRFAADQWLEFNFGMRPLVNDMRGLAEAIGRFGDSDRQIRTRLRATGKSERLMQSRTLSQVHNSYGYYFQHIHLYGRTRVVYRIGLRYTPSGPFDSAKRLAELCGLTPDDFVPTIWQVLPTTWIIDMFTNIGDILTARWTDTSVVSWVCKTVINEGEEKSNTSPNIEAARQALGANFLDFTGSFGSYQSFARSISRTNSGIQPPEWTFTVPGLSDIRWINLAALVGQFNDLNRTSFYRR